MNNSQIDRDLIKTLFVEKEMSTRMIEKETGFSRYNIRMVLDDYGISRTKKEATAISEKHKRQYHKYNPSMHTDEAIAKNLLKRWPNGFKEYYIKNGYKLLTRGVNANKGEHDIIIENQINRKLNKGEIVHHKNGNRSDNRLENLVLMSRSEHIMLHTAIRLNKNKSAFYDIFESTMKTNEISKKHGIDRHLVSRYRMKKDIYYKLLKNYTDECK